MSNKNKFAVVLPAKNVDTTGIYKKAIMEQVNKYPWLKVAGVDSPFYTSSGKEIRGVGYAGPGNLVTFGSAASHDVNWIERSSYACEKSLVPIYDAVKDFNLIKSKIAIFAAGLKPQPVFRPCSVDTTYNLRGNGTFYGTTNKVEVTDNFVKVGYDIIPRTEPAKVAYIQPVYARPVSYPTYGMTTGNAYSYRSAYTTPVVNCNEYDVIRKLIITIQNAR